MLTPRDTTSSSQLPLEQYEIIVDVKPELVTGTNGFSQLQRLALVEQFKLDVPATSFHINGIDVYQNGKLLTPHEQKQFWYRVSSDPRAALSERYLLPLGSAMGPLSQQDEFIKRLSHINHIMQCQSGTYEAPHRQAVHFFNKPKQVNSSIKCTDIIAPWRARVTDTLAKTKKLADEAKKELASSSTKPKGIAQFVYKIKNAEYTKLKELDNNLSNVNLLLGFTDSMIYYREKRRKKGLRPGRTNDYSLRNLAIDGEFALLDTSMKYMFGKHLLKPMLQRAIVGTLAVGSISISAELMIFGASLFITKKTWGYARSFVLDRIHPDYVDHTEHFEKIFLQSISQYELPTAKFELRFNIPQRSLQPTQHTHDSPCLTESAIQKIVCDHHNVFGNPASFKDMIKERNTIFKDPAASSEVSPYSSSLNNIVIPDPLLKREDNDRGFGFSNGQLTYSMPLGKNTQASASIDAIGAFRFLRLIFKRLTLSDAQTAQIHVDNSVLAFVKNPNNENKATLKRHIKRSARLNQDNVEEIKKLELLTYCVTEKNIDGLWGFAFNDAERINRVVDSYNSIQKQRAEELIWKNTTLTCDHKTQGDVLYSQGKIEESILSYEAHLRSTPYPDSKQAYHTRKKIFEYYSKRNEKKKAIEMAWEILKYPGSNDDFFVLGNNLKDIDSNEAACFMMAHVANQDIEKNNLEKQKTNIATKYLWEYFLRENQPASALHYIKCYLKTNPTSKEAWSTAEDICLQENALDILENLYQEHASDNNIATEKHNALVHYQQINRAGHIIDGATTLLQLFANIKRQGLTEENSIWWSRGITTFNIAAPLIQHGAIPYLRHTAYPKKHPNKINTRQLGVAGGIAAGLGLLHYLQEKNLMGLGEDDVRYKTNLSLEGAFLATDLYGLIKSYSLSRPTAGAQELTYAAYELIQESQPVISMGNNLNRTPLLESSSTAPDPTTPLIDGALNTASAVGLSLHAYEFGCRVTNADLPESTSFHVAKNCLTYTPAAVKGSTLLLTGFETTWIAVGGKVIAFAASSLTGFTIVVVAGAAGTYLVYQGGNWIHENITIAGKNNNICSNADKLAQNKNFKQAILKLDNIPEKNRTLTIESQRSNYQCQLFFQENNPLAVIAEANKQLSHRDQLSKNTVKSFLENRLYAAALLKESTHVDIKTLHQDSIDLAHLSENKKEEDKRYRQQVELFIFNTNNRSIPKRYFEDAINKNPDDIDARLHLSHIERVSGNYRKAEKIAEEAERIAEAICQKRSSTCSDFKAAKNIAEEAKEKQRAISEDIQSAWSTCIGHTVGHVAGDAAGQAIGLGIKFSLGFFRDNETEIACKMPFWKKAGTYSRNPAKEHSTSRASLYTYS